MTHSASARRLFAHGIHEQPRSMKLLWRILLPLLIVHVVLATWSGYRAIVQVFDLDLHVTNTALRQGATLGYDVVTSGRATVTVRLELIQSAHAETLVVRDVPGSFNPSYDPRSRKGSAIVALSPEVMSRFAPGPAVVRVTAIGRSQWLRTPPPTIRETPVTIQR
jgi:hypothetical protein